MNNINILDHETINKIAAGEVVERPVSVVKELVENAIDSDASAITVEISGGGIDFIRITDNGFGIPKDQIQKAFLRHATSKLVKVEDLSHLTSLGFRGEALSSISAISKVELITKTQDQLTGIRYIIEGTVEKEVEEVGSPNGTTIIVKNLFFNTPARRKFLKTAATEGSLISDMLERIALSKPQIAFKFVVNGKTKFYTLGNGLLEEVIYRIYGKEVASEIIPIQNQMDGMILTGFIGKPSIARSNRNVETYFMNTRYVRSDLIAKSIEEGYRTFLMQHKYPFCVLHLQMDTQKIDVNVHPTKMDVRFSMPQEVSLFLTASITQTLSIEALIPEISFSTKEKKQQIQDVEKKEKNKKLSIPEPFEFQRIQTCEVAESAKYEVNSTKMQDNFQNFSKRHIFGEIVGSEVPKNDNIHANIVKQKDHIIVEKAIQMDIFKEEFLTDTKIKDYHILGQLFSTYWVISYEDNVLFVDQHAAHEKIKYESLLKQMKEKSIQSQQLLPPIIVTLTSKEEDTFKKYETLFCELGFSIDEFGGNEYAIRSVPLDLFGCNEKQLFLETLDTLMEGNIQGTATVVLEKIASMACKAAVKGNATMSIEEAKQLFEQLLLLDNPYHCPHGRPTIVTMSKYEMEKKFKRIL